MLGREGGSEGGREREREGRRTGGHLNEESKLTKRKATKVSSKPLAVLT